MKKPLKKAFSIAEIGVILLIISILFAAITEGTNLYRKSKLASARNLTQNSPVNYLEGLTLWIESTSKDSFDDETPGNNDAIQNWHNINNRIESLTLTQSNPAMRPIYLSNGINGLPAIHFPGVQSTSDPRLYIDNLQSSKLVSADEGTIFMVKITNSSLIDSHLLGWTSVSIHDIHSGNFIWYFGGATNQRTSTDSISDDIGESFYDKPRIVVLRRSLISSETGMKIDGLQITPDITATSTDMDASASSDFVLGSISKTSQYSMNSVIGEIIFFNRPLSDDEIKTVEGYLSQKWKISLN